MPSVYNFVLDAIDTAIISILAMEIRNRYIINISSQNMDFQIDIDAKSIPEINEKVFLDNKFALEIIQQYENFIYMFTEFYNSEPYIKNEDAIEVLRLVFNMNDQEFFDYLINSSFKKFIKENKSEVSGVRNFAVKPKVKGYDFTEVILDAFKYVVDLRGKQSIGIVSARDHTKEIYRWFSELTHGMM